MADHSRIVHARSVLSDVLAGRASLRRAAITLGLSVEELPRRRPERRLAVYRAYIGQAVQTASPLLIRVCEQNGVSLDELVLKLRPGMVWDQAFCGVRPHDVWARGVLGKVNVGEAPADLKREWAAEAWLHSAWLVYSPENLDLLFGVRVLDAGLETAAFPGGHRLRTHGSEGSITLRTDLPDTIMSALPGMMLDRSIDHPLINGAGCVVTAVDEPTLRWGTKIRFALDPVPWHMPWAR